MTSREEIAVRLLRGALRAGQPPGAATLRVRGACMEPLLREGDWVTVGPAEALPPPGRVVLARTAADELVCHRVLAPTENGCRLAGDRSVTVEEVPWAAVLGVVRWVRRDRRRLRLDARFWRPIDHALAVLHRRTLGASSGFTRRLTDGLRRCLLVVRNLAWLGA